MKSKYFNLEDVNSANSAKKHKIKDNSIPDYLLPNAHGLARDILDPMAHHLPKNSELTVTTWYRNKALNKAVKGAKNSGHMDGGTADITINKQAAYKPSINQLLIRKRYDKLIVYLDDKDRINHLHISWADNPKNNLYITTTGSNDYMKIDEKNLARFLATIN